MEAMDGLKKFGLVVCVLLFGPLFVLCVVAYGFRQTAGNEAYVKRTIAEAKFYDAVGNTIVTQAVGESGGEPVITAALQSAVTGDKIQTALEPLITGTYAWLGGNTAKPAFALEIGPIQSNFEQSLSSALHQRAASLPACTYANPPTGDSIYNLNCIPPGTDVDATISDAISRVTNTASVFSNEVVTDGTVSTEEAASLGVQDPTQNLPESLPRTYQFLVDGFWFFVGGTVLTAVGIVLLSRTWLYGVRKLGVLLLLNGLGLLVVGLVLHFAVSSLIPTTAVEATELTVNAIEDVFKTIVADNASLLKLTGLIAVVTGLVGIVGSSVAISKQAKPTTPPQPPKAG